MVRLLKVSGWRVAIGASFGLLSEMRRQVALMVNGVTAMEPREAGEVHISELQGFLQDL